MNLSEIVFKVESEDESINDTGTAFLITENLALTAFHVIKNFSDKLITLTKDDMSYKAMLSKKNTDTYTALDLALLELQVDVPNVDMITFSEHEEIDGGTKWRSRGFPVAKASDGENINENDDNTVNQHKLELNERNVDIFLDHNKKLKNYSGMSGAPLIIDNKIAGVIKADYRENGNSIELNAISVKYFKDLIPNEIYHIPTNKHNQTPRTKTVFNLPFRAKDEGVIGREGNVSELREALNSNRRTSIGHAISFSGIGGLGKTQLAIEYSYRYRDEYKGGVFWFDAEKNIPNQILKIANDYDWFPGYTKTETRINLSINKIRSINDSLIIFDNVDDLSDIEEYLPVIDSFPHILITSRNRINGFHNLDIDLLDYEESKEMLLSESNRCYPLTSSESESCNHILEMLDGLPLAIEVAGGFLNVHQDITFKEYEGFIKEDFKEVISRNDYDSFTKHKKGIFKTLNVSESRIDDLLKDILTLLAWSASASMSESLLLAMLGNNLSKLDFRRSISVGMSLKLLKQTNDGRYSIHRLVREVEQSINPIDNHIERGKTVCSRMINWFDKRKSTFSDLSIFEGEIEHLEYWLEIAEKKSWPLAASLAWLHSYPSRQHSDYENNRDLLLKAKVLSEQINVDPLITANILRDLASNPLINDGSHLFVQALAIYQRLRPQSDSALAKLQVYLGLERNDFPEVALEHYKEALDIYLDLVKKGDAKYNFYVAQCYHNIAGVYADFAEKTNLDKEKNIKAAINFQNKAISIWKQYASDDNPRIATGYNNLGHFYSFLGQSRRALEFHNTSLDTKISMLHRYHEEIAFSYHNLGANYYNMGDFINSSANAKEAILIFSHKINIQVHEMNMINSFELLISSLLKLEDIAQAEIELSEYRKINYESCRFFQSIVDARDKIRSARL
ncbi:trypsin-like peptidase domain-containing protein [Vibrio splendidus]